MKIIAKFFSQNFPTFKLGKPKASLVRNVVDATFRIRVLTMNTTDLQLHLITDP